MAWSGSCLDCIHENCVTSSPTHFKTGFTALSYDTGPVCQKLGMMLTTWVTKLTTTCHDSMSRILSSHNGRVRF